MRDKPYFVQAQESFLENLPFSSPEEAVRAGVRTVREWCAVLEASRPVTGTNPREAQILGLLEIKPRTRAEMRQAMGLSSFVNDLMLDLRSRGLIVETRENGFLIARLPDAEQAQMVA